MLPSAENLRIGQERTCGHLIGHSGSTRRNSNHKHNRSMETADRQPRPEAPATLAWGIASVALSLASLAAFSLYCRWHWDLFWLRWEGTLPPFWLTWGLVDGLKLVSVLSAILGFGLAIRTLRRKRFVIGIVALALALLSLLTVPLVT